MALRASKRKNVVVRGEKKLRLPDVPTFKIEQEYWDRGVAYVAGLDEVGRGALAGPVTVGVCVFAAGERIYKIRDSKVLDAARRKELVPKIQGRSVACAVGHASESEIDEFGIVWALGLAAKRALGAIQNIEVDVILLDGNYDYIGDERVRPVVYGDSLSITIAAASILAKVERDSVMTEYALQYPDYGFDGHKGYSSAGHLEVLRRAGPASIHRKSFAPVAEVLGKTRREVKVEAMGQLSLPG